MAEEEILRLTIDSRGAEEGARKTVRSLDEVRAASGRAGQSQDELEKKFRGIATAGAGVAALVGGKLTSSWTGFRAVVRGVGSQLVDITQVGLRGVSVGLRTMADGLRNSNGELTTVGKTLAVTSVGVDKFADVLSRAAQIMLGMKVAAAAGAASVAVLAHQAAAEFTPAWQRVVTLLGEGDWDKLRSQVSGLAGDLGQDNVVAANTFYQVLSAMPQLVREPAQALDVLDASLAAASTGFTNAEEAASAITGILNAFNLEASEARRVSDALFAAQDQGVTTFGEIAASMGSVADLASSLGGEFEDVLGILATTAEGTATTAERLTQLRGVISAVIKPTAEASRALEGLDVDLSASALSTAGLNNYLVDLIEATDGNPDILARVFPQESLAIMLALARQTDELRENTAGIGDAAEKTARNVDIVNDSWQRQKEILGNQLDDILTQIGLKFEGIGTTGLTAVNAWIEGWRNAGDELERINRQFDEAIARQDRLYQMDQFNGGQPILLPAVQAVGPGRARRSDPIARPAEPIGADYSTKKIREYEQALTAAANMALARTNDLAAYEDALEDAERAVNQLILAEIERNRAAGVEQSELDTLANMYRAGKQAVDEFRVSIENLQGVLAAEGIGEKLALPEGFGDHAYLDPEARDRYLEERDRRRQFTKLGGTTAKVTTYGPGRPDRAARPPDSETIRAITDGVRGVIDLADATGKLGDGTRQALTGINNLVGAIDSFQNASTTLGKIGAAAGIVGAGASLISGIVSAINGRHERAKEVYRNRQDFEQDFNVRTLEASGRTEEADRLSLIVRQERELREARVEGSLTAEQLTRMEELHKVELEALETAQRDATRAAEEASRIRQIEADGYAANIQSRAMHAQGLTAEAEDIQFLLGQQQELQDAWDQWGETNPELVQQLDELLQKEREYRTEQMRLAEVAFREDLRVRQFRAVGLNEEAEMLQMLISQRREVANAQASGFSDTAMAELEAVHNLEKLALEAERARAAREAEVTRLQKELQGIQTGIDEEIRTINDAAKAADQQLQDQAKELREQQRIQDALLSEQVDINREALQVAQDQLREAERSVGETRRVVESLREYLGSISLNPSTSILSPAEILNEAQRQFDQLLEAALGGNKASAGGLPDAANALLEAARTMFASTPGYVEIFTSVRDALDLVASNFEATLSTEEQSLELLESQVAHLDGVLASLDDQREILRSQTEAELAAIDDMREAIMADAEMRTEQLREQSAAITAGYEAQIAAVRETTSHAEQVLQTEAQKLLGSLDRLGGSVDGQLGAMLNMVNETTAARQATEVVAARVDQTNNLLMQLLHPLLSGPPGPPNDTTPWQIPNVPQFARGGFHTGGVRIIGEFGPEIEATGPSRIYSNSQLEQMIGGSSEWQAQELAELREQNRHAQAQVRLAQEAIKRSDRQSEEIKQELYELRKMMEAGA